MKKYLQCLLSATLTALFVQPVLAGSIPMSPDASANLKGVLDKAQQYDRDGKIALASGDAITAEADFRQAISIMGRLTFPWYSYDLAEALTAQGRKQEAMRVYQESTSTLMPSPAKEAMRADLQSRHMAPAGTIPDTGSCIALLRYALLLNDSGQWANAVATLGVVLPDFQRGGDRPNISVSLDPSVPQPVVLAAAAHVGLGVELSKDCSNWDTVNQRWGLIDHQKAQTEFAKGLELAPDWDVANYYYGFGLQHLGLTQQADAAFRKTVKMAKGDVKAAAEAALKKQKKSV